MVIAGAGFDSRRGAAYVWTLSEFGVFQGEGLDVKAPHAQEVVDVNGAVSELGNEVAHGAFVHGVLRLGSVFRHGVAHVEK